MVGTITNAGLEYEAKLLVGVSVKPFKYIAIGSGTTAEANNQTALVTEITTNGGARAEGTASYEADYKAVLSKTFTATGDLTVNEAGMFDDDGDPAGNMYARAKFASAKNLASGDTLQVTFTVTKGRA